MGLPAIKFLFITLALATTSSVFAFAEPSLMDAKYCADLFDGNKLVNSDSNQERINNKIALCSSHYFLKEHAAKGKSTYIDAPSHLIAKRDDYYCSIQIEQASNEQAKSSTILKAKPNSNLKCGLLSETHAKISENTEGRKKAAEGKASAEESEKNHTSIYSANSPKPLLELAIKNAKKDLAKSVQIAAFFRQLSVNNCQNNLLSHLNNYYDPLKSNLYHRFHAPGTKVPGRYRNWDCSPKEYDDSIKTSVEDEAYAASKVAPLLNQHIENFENLLKGDEGSVQTPGFSNKTNLFSGTGVRLEIEASNVVKTFFYKKNICTVIKTETDGYYDLKCMESLNDGFKLVSNFKGIPSVSHFGICSISDLTKEQGGPNKKNIEYASDSAGKFSKVGSITTDSIGNIKCVNDLITGTSPSSTLKANLETEINKIINKVVYKGPDSSVTMFENELKAAWAKNQYYNKNITVKKGNDKVVVSIQPLPPEIFVTEHKSCLGYGVNLSAKLISELEVKGEYHNKAANSNSVGTRTKNVQKISYITDKILTFSECDDNAVNFKLTLDKEVLAGPKEYYSFNVPRPLYKGFNHKRIKKIAKIQIGRTESGSLGVAPFESYVFKDTKRFNYLLNSGSVVLQEQSGWRRYNNILGVIQANTYYRELPNAGKEVYRSNTKMVANYCSSTAVVKDNCCFGLSEGQKSCQMKPLQLGNALISGTAAPISNNGSRPLNPVLNQLQNQSLVCMDASKAQDPECQANMNMVALGFISYMMEQYYQMQTALMFNNFQNSLAQPGANVQTSAQAANQVSQLNTQAQANSMLGLYMGAVAGTPQTAAIPITPNTNPNTGTVQPTYVAKRPVVAGVPPGSMLGSAFRATPYPMVFPGTSTSSGTNNWLQSGGQYAVARNLASEVALLQNESTRISQMNNLFSMYNGNRSTFGTNAISEPILAQNSIITTNGITTDVQTTPSPTNNVTTTSPEVKTTEPSTVSGKCSGTVYGASIYANPSFSDGSLMSNEDCSNRCKQVYDKQVSNSNGDNRLLKCFLNGVKIQEYGSLGASKSCEAVDKTTNELMYSTKSSTSESLCLSSFKINGIANINQKVKSGLYSVNLLYDGKIIHEYTHSARCKYLSFGLRHSSQVGASSVKSMKECIEFCEGRLEFLTKSSNGDPRWGQCFVGNTFIKKLGIEPEKVEVKILDRTMKRVIKTYTAQSKSGAIDFFNTNRSALLNNHHHGEFHIDLVMNDKTIHSYDKDGLCEFSSKQGSFGGSGNSSKAFPTKLDCTNFCKNSINHLKSLPAVKTFTYQCTYLGPVISEGKIEK